MSTRLDKIKARCEKATKGPWTALADGNQYLDTEYMPTAKCVASARVLGLQRPWNPHALLSFGFKPGEYETARFTEHDAAFIAAAREDVPFLLAELTAARELLRRAIDEERCGHAYDRCSWCGTVKKFLRDEVNASTSILEEPVRARRALIARVAELERENAALVKRADNEQTTFDGLVYYRNLAIISGAKPNQMLCAGDKKLCEEGIDPADDGGGYHLSVNDMVKETEALWEAVEQRDAAIRERDEARQALRTSHGPGCWCTYCETWERAERDAQVQDLLKK